LGLQFVLGAEFAGRISAASPIPAGCMFKPGDRVFGYAQGSFGEKVATSWKSILPMPSALSYDQAAGQGLVMAVLRMRRLTRAQGCSLRGRLPMRHWSDVQSSSLVGTSTPHHPSTEFDLFLYR
jgi:NADPH:quinone reductase-like Zn-dependent oxidoreductase